MRALLIAAAFVAAVSGPAGAQTYPTRQVTLVVPLSPGTGLDVVARVFAERLSQSLGRPVIVENKPGASTFIAINALMSAAADGHTLLVMPGGPLAINPTLFAKLPYDPPRDFVPLALYAKSPFVIVTNPGVPVRSFDELVAYVKAQPGKLNYSSTGVGAPQHLAAEMLSHEFGLAMVHVPYKASGQAVTDIMAGHIPLAFVETNVSMPLIRDGKLRPIAVSSLTRLKHLPEVPTIAEASGRKDFEAVSFHMLLAKTGTPEPIVNRLHDEMKRITSQPEVADRIVATGLIPVDSPSVQGMRDYMRDETERWGSVVRKIGLAGSQ